MIGFINRKDREQKFLFGTLQSESGQSILKNYCLKDKGIDSVF